MSYTGTDCVICKTDNKRNPGVTTRFVKKVGYIAWVCRRHEKKD